MVRLSQEEVNTLVTAGKQAFGDTASIWLFGSRADESAFGGDIDVYIETDLDKDLVNAKVFMRTKLWDCFGDQKIDTSVRSRHKPLSPIGAIAKEHGVLLSS